MATDSEIALACDPDFDREALLSWLRERGEPTPGKPDAHRDVYVDTPRDDVRAAGLSARCRTIDGRRRIDVQPVPIAAGLLVSRVELTTEVSSDAQIGPAVRDLLHDRLGISIAADADPVAELHVQRECWSYAAPTYSAWLSFHRIAASLPEERTQATLCELTIALREGDPEGPRRLARKLVRKPGLAFTSDTAYERARALLGLAPYAYGEEPPDFDDRSATGAVARRFCLAQLRTMRAHEVGARVGLDTEHLHKMRVAVRRMRSALRLFRDALPDGEREGLDAELRWLGKVLGEVRDLDVHRLALPKWRARLGNEPARGWDALERALADAHRSARGRMLAAVTSARYHRLCESAEVAFDDRAQHPGPPLADEPIGRAAGRLLRRPIRKFSRAYDRFRSSHTADDAHRMRIAAKALRYSTELLRPVLQARVWRRARRLGRFQDALGELQDAAQAGALARGLAAGVVSRDVESAYANVLGRLAGWSASTTQHAPVLVDRAVDDLGADDLLDALRS